MRFWNRFRLRTRGASLHSELSDEIRLHREMLQEEFIRDTCRSWEAARAAAQQFAHSSSAAGIFAATNGLFPVLTLLRLESALRLPPNAPPFAAHCASRRCSRLPSESAPIPQS